MRQPNNCNKKTTPHPTTGHPLASTVEHVRANGHRHSHRQSLGLISVSAHHVVHQPVRLGSSQIHCNQTSQKGHKPTCLGKYHQVQHCRPCCMASNSQQPDLTHNIPLAQASHMAPLHTVHPIHELGAREPTTAQTNLSVVIRNPTASAMHRTPGTLYHSQRTHQSECHRVCTQCTLQQASGQHMQAEALLHLRRTTHTACLSYMPSQHTSPTHSDRLQARDQICHVPDAYASAHAGEHSKRKQTASTDMTLLLEVPVSPPLIAENLASPCHPARAP